MSQRSSRRSSQRSTLTQTVLEEPSSNLDVNIEDQTNDLVRYIIYRGGEHMLLKRSELQKNGILKSGRSFEDIISRARVILKEVYGYNLLVCDSLKGKDKSYVVSNELIADNIDTNTTDETETVPKDAYKILLLLVLTHVYMSNNTVTDASLYGFLKSVKIDVDSQHPVFGNVKDYIIKTLPKQHYIRLEIDPVTKRQTFSWGERAEKEISMHNILKFVCKIYEDRLPKSWEQQYKIACEQGFENEQVGIENHEQMEEI